MSYIHFCLLDTLDTKKVCSLLSGHVWWPNILLSPEKTGCVSLLCYYLEEKGPLLSLNLGLL